MRSPRLAALSTAILADACALAGAARGASKSRTLTNQSLEIENRKYLNGNSSNGAIAKLQNDLATAELAGLGALRHHAQAQTTLLLATGQLLDKRHVKIEVAEER